MNTPKLPIDEMPEKVKSNTTKKVASLLFLVAVIYNFAVFLINNSGYRPELDRNGFFLNELRYLLYITYLLMWPNKDLFSVWMSKRDKKSFDERELTLRSKVYVRSYVALYATLLPATLIASQWFGFYGFTGTSYSLYSLTGLVLIPLLLVLPNVVALWTKKV